MFNVLQYEKGEKNITQIEYQGDDQFLSIEENKKKSKGCIIKDCPRAIARRKMCRFHYEESKEKKCKECDKTRYRDKYCKDHFFKITKCSAYGCGKPIFNAKYKLCKNDYRLFREILSKEENT